MTRYDMTVEIGDKAPNFTLPATGGKDITLSDYKGQIVVVYFYPRDDTPGCTKQACSFSDNFNALKKQNVVVIGISKDSIKSHEKFKEKYGLNFDLASDTSTETIQAFGSWIEKSMYGKKYMGINRDTYLIDEKGVIQHIWRKVNVEGHTEDVLAQVEKLKQAQAA